MQSQGFQEAFPYRNINEESRVKVIQLVQTQLATEQ